MPAGVDVLVDGPYARISFPDASKRGPALKALLDTGAPIEIRTGGRRREYIVPEGNAREAGLIDEPDTDSDNESDKSDETSENAEVTGGAEEDSKPDTEPAAETAKKAPAKKAPAKKAAPAAAKKEDGDA